MGFIYVTSMLSKSDESHIVCSVACEATIYSAFVNDIAIEVYFLLFQVLISPFPNKKT